VRDGAEHEREYEKPQGAREGRGVREEGEGCEKDMREGRSGRGKTRRDEER